MKKAIKKRILHRIRIIQGQLNGLEKMIDKEVYCIDIINQSSAIRESLKSIELLMLENHLLTHVAEQMASAKKSSAIKELLSIYKETKKRK